MLITKEYLFCILSIYIFGSKVKAVQILIQLLLCAFEIGGWNFSIFPEYV